MRQVENGRIYRSRMEKGVREGYGGRSEGSKRGVRG